jgi:hypothetical protein
METTDYLKLYEPSRSAHSERRNPKNRQRQLKEVLTRRTPMPDKKIYFSLHEILKEAEIRLVAWEAE